MSAGKEIRSKIKSVQNTQKITRAMQMVSTSKMRKTQEKMRQARPYAMNVRRVIANLANINPVSRAESPFLRNSVQIKRVGIVVITADKGLCGGLNSNAVKLYFEKIKGFKAENIDVETCTFGQKAFAAANRIGANVISSAVGLGDVPHMEKLVGPLSIMLKKFHDEELDAIYVIYSHFVNTMKQAPTCEQLLPLKEDDLKVKGNARRDYIFEPSALEVLEEFIKRYVEAVVYQCLADNMASEQAARMIAMKAATDNAGSAISNLKLVYNKSRQAAITKELAEIVAGSAAV